MYVTRCLLHVPVMMMQDISMRDTLLYLMHHSLSVLCFGGALCSGNMHYWSCLDGCCEVTNFFLNNVYLFKHVIIKGDSLQTRHPVLYVIIGAFLWITYLVFRIFLFPYWMYTWYVDVRNAPTRSWDTVSDFERYLYPSVTVFLLFLSIFWFMAITRGLLKAVTAATGSNGSSNGHKKEK